MGRIGMVLFLGGSLWLLEAATLHAELWRCNGPAGTEVFTNTRGEGTACRAYEPRPPIGIVAESAASRSPVSGPSLTGKKTRPTLSEEGKRMSQFPKDSEHVMSFETLRLLSTGMTKSEVLSRAGPPRYDFKNSRANRWVYFLSDHWIAEIVFSGNRVAGIKWTRSRP